MLNPRQVITALKQNIGKVIVGKDEVIELLLIAMLCKGHVLIEDVPGTGKTTLASALAKSLDCSFNRIQFTPDVVPSEYRAEAVFEALVENGLTAEKRVLIPRAQEAREALPRLLASFGAQVDVVPVYRTELPASSSADRTRSLFASGNVDAVTFTSSSTVRNLLTLLGAEAHELLRSIDLFSGTHGLPELLCVAVCALLHLWKRNELLSIFGSTILYMVLVQVVFQ